MSYNAEVLADSPLWFGKLTDVGHLKKTATASSNFTGEIPANAFDGSTATRWTTNTGAGGAGWLRMEFQAAIALTGYSILRRDDIPLRNPKDWTFEGSNDGSSWTTLDTQSGVTWPTPGQTQNFSFSNTTAYLYYRINITAPQVGHDGYASIADMDFVPGSAIMADSSGNSRHGTWTPPVLLQATGLVTSDSEKSVDFVGGVGAVADAAWLDTIRAGECVFVADTIAAGTRTLMSRHISGSSFTFRQEAAALKCYVWPTGGGAFYTLTASTTLVAGTTYHAAWEHDGTNLKIYVGGVQVASVVGAVPIASSDAFRIGGSGPGELFDGKIQKAALYSAALGATRWAAHVAAMSATVISGALATETDSALTAAGTIVGTKVTGALATEADTALAGTAKVGARVVGGLALETDTGLTGSVVTGGIVIGALATETDTALAGTVAGSVVVTGSLASETDTALAGTTAVGYIIAGGLATEADSALAGILALTTTGTSQVITFLAGLGIMRTPMRVNLVILDPSLEQAPTAVQVTVDSADPGETLTFYIDDVEVWSTVADSEGNLGVTSIPVPDDAGIGDAGSHILKVSSPLHDEDEETFTLHLDPPGAPPGQADDTDPVLVESSEGSWVLQDVMPGGLGSWVMPINPTSMTSPHLQKQTSVEHTTAPHTGQYHVTEQGLTSRPWSVSGYCPNEAFHDELVAYAGLNRRIYVIDHRGRAWKVAITSLELTPRRRQVEDGVLNDWAHNYKLDMLIVEQNSLVPA